MDGIENDRFCLSRSQDMSDLRSSRGSYNTVSILRVVVPSIQTSSVT